MTYNRLHRIFLRTVASRGVLSTIDSLQILTKFAGGDISDSALRDLVKEINDEIRPFKQMLKIANDELTDEEVVIFLSLGYDDATKAQGVFTATELEYYRILIEQIMTTETRQITDSHAINLVSQMKSSFTKTDGQKLLKTWCNMKYLAKDNNHYALGVRAIHEFESYLRENMPDTIEECCLCKQIVFRGCNCPACAKAVHTRCLNRYLETMQKWPCCKADYSPEQLERLSRESSRQTANRLINAQKSSGEQNTSMEEPPELEPTVVLEESETVPESLSQEIIPEISQRVTRKRKRV